MQPHRAVFWTIVAIGFIFAANQVIAAQVKLAATAVLFGGKLIGLVEKGRFHVWSLDDGGFDADASSKLSQTAFTHLASADGKLWAADRSTLYSGSLEARSWKKEFDFNAGGEELQALVEVGGTPFLIFPTNVKNPAGRRTFRVPALKAQVPRNSPRILALHAAPSRLWIGTGNGEWGGHLVGLNPKTGEWVQYHAELHYVTGITQATLDELIVNWSMSHRFRQEDE